MRDQATYEWLRHEVSSLQTAIDPRTRRLVWATESHVLALSRDTVGKLEVYIEGAPIVATTKTVAEVLEHQVWQTDDGNAIAATRLVLPAGEHFDQFGALLCVELIDHQLEDDRQAAFSAVEPLIALALTRQLVSDLTVLGLIGELAFLERLLAASDPEEVHYVLGSWAGSAPSARDFQLGSVGVEVKTTQGASSTHHVSGVHQVEIGHSNGDVPETTLYILSLGIAWLENSSSSGQSLPELVDLVLTHLENPADRADLLARIKQYGGDAAVGYDHERDRAKQRYSARFYFKFERLYDMSDDRLSLLTSTSLASLANVDPGSVEFRVVLPDRVRGELNPLVGWQRSVIRVLEVARARLAESPVSMPPQ